jgi:hypothetical protein
MKQNTHPDYVETGLRGDVNTEIKSGLAEGDEILTAGR